MKWSYIAQLLNISSGLLLLPAVLHYLDKSDVGLWFVFVTIGGLAQLLEFGFQPTISRNAAYIFAGARSLSASGLPSSLKPDNEAAVLLLADLISSSRLIYRLVATIAGVLLVPLGGVYIATLLSQAQSLPTVLTAWLLFAVGNVANLYFGYATALLIGCDYINESSKGIVISRCVFLVCGVVLLAFGCGLLGLGVSMLFSSAFGRLYAIRALARHPQIRRSLIIAPMRPSRAIAQMLWYNASRQGLVQVSTFVVQRANILVASSFLGLQAAASFGMTVSILHILSSMSMVAIQVRMPRIALWQTENRVDMLRLAYREIMVLSIGLYCVLFVGTIAIAPTLTSVFASGTALLPRWQFIALGIIFALEINHSIATVFISTLNKIPFVYPSVISGVSTLVLSLMLVEEMQAAGLILSQGFVQLCYNNWKWPMVVQKQLGLSWISLFRSTLTGQKVCGSVLREVRDRSKDANL